VDAGFVVIPQHNQYEDANPVLQRILRARDRCMSFWASINNPPQSVLLPDPLPPTHRLNDYTLVLDLEGTLIGNSWHLKHGWRAVKRPGMDVFLEQCAAMFGEVVVFADRQLMDCLPVLDRLDPDPANPRIMYRLHRGNMRAVQGEYYKDLSLLGRDLRKVIIVDDVKERFALQPYNGIKIDSYNGDDNDRALLELLPFLQTIVQSNIPDVRIAIRRYEKYDNIPAAFLEIKRAQLAKKNQAKTPLDVPMSSSPVASLGLVAPRKASGENSGWLSKLLWGG
jgi:hypothetical protein